MDKVWSWKWVFTHKQDRNAWKYFVATYIKGKKRISNVQVVGYSNEVR